MSAVPDRFLSLEEYFQLGETSEVKHEYYQGASSAMTGTSIPHNLMVANVISTLHAQLRGKSCTVYPSDLRVKVEATGLYTYPDAQVICGSPRTAERSDTVTNPTTLIEVLSPSTEGYDRGKKFQHYRAIETLRDYVVIAQDSVHVEHYTRQNERQWLLNDFTSLDQTVHLASIDCTLALAVIYEKITFVEE
jgi:Uma2 family endonuclease